ncbi:MAG: CRISPR-associated ring nuclease [Chloroflexota bacterium]
MQRENTSAILIATLGTEPQVVTAALDLLHRKGEQIRQVQVVHTVAPFDSLIHRSLAALQKAFEADYGGEKVQLSCFPIVDQRGQPLADVETEAASRAVFGLLYRLVRQAKLEGARVHLSIAGGRKTMAVFGMAAAQLLFDKEDCLWHLYSSGDFLTSKRLHPQSGDEVHLVPIPVALWSSVSPALLDVARVDDPFEAFDRQRTERLREEMRQAQEFVSHRLTRNERTAVALLVGEMLSDEEIAQRLHKSRRTVEQQLRSAYLKARDYYQIGEVNRTHLIALLRVYFAFQKGEENVSEV